MKRISALAGVFAAMAASPAMAHDQEQLDCIVRATPMEVRGGLVDATLLEGTGENLADDARVEQFYDAAMACIDEIGIDPARQIAYLTYAEARVFQVEMAARLAGRGISTAVIDQALDYGPGLTNPVIDMPTDGQTEAVAMSLLLDGVDVDALPQEVWEDIGTYLAATSATYVLLGELE